MLVAFQEGGLFGRYYYILLSTEYSGSGQLLFVFSVQRSAMHTIRLLGAGVIH